MRQVPPLPEYGTDAGSFLRLPIISDRSLKVVTGYLSVKQPRPRFDSGAVNKKKLMKFEDIVKIKVWRNIKNGRVYFLSGASISKTNGLMPEKLIIYYDLEYPETLYHRTLEDFLEHFYDFRDQREKP